jgi:hypothetical protein
MGRLLIGPTDSSSLRFFSMIIRWQWDESLEALLADERLPNAVSEILRAHRQGNHLLVVERAVAEKLSGLQVSGSDVALLRRLAAEFTQTGALHRRSQVYISIQNSFDDYVERAGACVHVSLGTMLQSRLTDPTTLIVENIATDGWLLEQILTVTALRNRLGTINLDTVHGGGDDIANVLDVLIPKLKNIVVLVDSDKNAPMSPPPAKLARLDKVVKKHAWEFIKVDCPPCRELENLIPLDVLMALPSGLGCDANPVLLRVAEAEERDALEPLDRLSLYLDLKLGITEKSLADLSANERAWIEEKIKLGGFESDVQVPGYGDKLINQIKADGRHISDFRSSLQRNDWLSKFASFFSDILWYFVANRRLIT